MTKKVKTKDLQLKDQKSVMDFLKNPTIRIAEAVTGILISEEKDWKFSAGKIVQAAIKGKFLTQLGKEIEDYRKKGEIKEDYFATNKNRATLYELLKFLDEEVPDEELFVAVKSIFFSGISKDATAYDEALAYEFLQTAKHLSGTEILILKANYELAKGKVSSAVPKESLVSNQTSRSVWRRIIAKQMGYGDLHSVVAKYEQNLESLGLISPRNEMDRLQGEFESPANRRLTDVGIKFCEFIIKYKHSEEG